MSKVVNHGPSAVGTDPRRFFNLVYTLAITDFKLKFFGSVLGYLWSLIRPLMLFTVLYLVFSKVAKFDSDIHNYPTYLLTAIMLWFYFVEITSISVTSLIDRESLLRKTIFPMLVIPLSVALTAFFNLCANLIVIFVFVFVTGLEPNVDWLQMPLIILFITIFSLGVGMILSSLYVKYRDIQPAWDSLMQVLFYSSPILYIATTYPDSVRDYALSSPMAAAIAQMGHAFIDPSSPAVTSIYSSPYVVLIPVATVVLTFALGVWTFLRATPTIAENL